MWAMKPMKDLKAEYFNILSQSPDVMSTKLQENHCSRNIHIHIFKGQTFHFSSVFIWKILWRICFPCNPQTAFVLKDHVCFGQRSDTPQYSHFLLFRWNTWSCFQCPSVLYSSRALKGCYKLQNLVCHRTELCFSEKWLLWIYIMGY